MRKLVSCLLACALATHAHAALWNVDPATSTLTFEGEHAGEKFKGRFPKFTSVIDFDESAPEKGKIEITVDMASATIEGKDRQEAFPGADWFAVKQFPVATFVSTAITAPNVYNKPGTNLYIAKGRVTIRGVSKEVELPFALHQIGDSSHQMATVMADGALTLNRQDFGVGQGEWKSDAYIKNPVTVKFMLRASQ